MSINLYSDLPPTLIQEYHNITPKRSNQMNQLITTLTFILRTSYTTLPFSTISIHSSTSHSMKRTQSEHTSSLTHSLTHSLLQRENGHSFTPINSTAFVFTFFLFYLRNRVQLQRISISFFPSIHPSNGA